MSSDKTIDYSGKKRDEPSLEEAPKVHCLVVLSGPDQGAVYPLQDGETVIGRALDGTQIALTEPGISRIHAKFRVEKGNVFAKDLGSTNGTFLNGKRIEEGQVFAGDTLGIGGRTSVRLIHQDEETSRILVGLYNDAVLDSSGVLSYKSLQSRLKASSECSLAVVEIDQVQQVRDRFGHKAEEELVSHIASILKNDLADRAAVGRLSGEGFLVNLYSRALDSDEVLESARRTIECNHFRVDTGQGPEFIRVTISTGIAAFVDKEEFDETLQAAEKALQMAKQMGRNRIHLSERKKFGR